MAVRPRTDPDMASITSRQNLEGPDPPVPGDKVSSEKGTSFRPQERSHPPEPIAAFLEAQPGPKGERNSFPPLEKSEAAKRIRPSPSSPEVHPAALSAGQPTLSALMKEMVAAKGMLQQLSESSTEIKAELSKMQEGIAKINVWMERGELRMEQDGNQRGAGAEKWEPPLLAPETPLCSEEKLLFSPKLKMERPQVQQTSEIALAAVGEETEQPSIGRERRVSLVQGGGQPSTPEALGLNGEEKNEQLLLSICSSQAEENGSQSSSEGSSSTTSASDILLATLADLKNSTTATTNATAAKLMTILEEHRSNMKDKVLDIVEGICVQMRSIPDGGAKRVALNVVASLAEEYSGDVVSSLLKYSLPCDSSISEVWRSLCSVPETGTQVMWHVLKELKQRPRFHENGDGSSSDGAWLVPLAATRALGEMLKIFTCIGVMRGFYPQVFLALVTQVHFLVSLPEYTEESRNERNSLAIAGHVRFALEALKTLLTQDRNHMAVLWMEKTGCWDLLSSPEHYLEGILLLARALVTHTRHHLTGLLAEVVPKLRAEDEEKTLTARALFVGFLCSKSTVQLLPLQSILSKLEDWQMDPRPTVRWLSLHGFGNMALHGQKAKHLEAVVSMILAGLKEPDEKPVKEAVRALGNVLSCHQGRVCLGSMCVRIAEKLKPLLADERDQVRSAAIGLFGKLLPRLSRRHKSPMREQVLSNIILLLLHLQDHSQDVVENCEWTLARCNNFLGWKLLEEITVLAHYDSQQALSTICRLLVRRYPERVPAFLTYTLDYLRSPAAPMRRAASMLTGFLVFYTDAKVVSKEVMTSLMIGLCSLLHDPEPSVSSAASISLLQVNQPCSNTSAHRLLRALGSGGCYICSLETEKPVFEDSPFKRKRCLDVPDEPCLKL